MASSEREWYVTHEMNGTTYAIEFVWFDEIEWSPLSDDNHITTFTFDEACELAGDGLDMQVKRYSVEDGDK